MPLPHILCSFCSARHHPPRYMLGHEYRLWPSIHPHRLSAARSVRVAKPQRSPNHIQAQPQTQIPSQRQAGPRNERTWEPRQRLPSAARQHRRFSHLWRVHAARPRMLGLARLPDPPFLSPCWQQQPFAAACFRATASRDRASSADCTARLRIGDKQSRFQHLLAVAASGAVATRGAVEALSSGRRRATVAPKRYPLTSSWRRRVGSMTRRRPWAGSKSEMDGK